MPLAKACSRDAESPRPVMATMIAGEQAFSLSRQRMARAAWNPFMIGILMSIRMTSGLTTGGVINSAPEDDDDPLDHPAALL